MTAVSIAREIRLTPQAKTVLSHIEKRGAISPMEALTTYGISRLAAAVYEIRKAGHAVQAVIKHDAAGHKYTRYTLLNYLTHRDAIAAQNTRGKVS